MDAKHKKVRLMYVLLCLAAMLIAAIITYRIYITDKEQYYRDFYRADIEIAQQYYYSYQEVYDTIVKGNYDSSTMIAFFESADYTEVVQKMTEQIDVRKNLYAQYPVVDFSLLNLLEKDLKSLKEYASWVLSDEFDPNFSESYFKFLGLHMDRSSSLAEMDEYMTNPKFPSKSDNYLNNALGKTMLVTDFHLR